MAIAYGAIYVIPINCVLSRVQWIQEHQDAKVILLDYINTDANQADLLTKGLMAERTWQLRQLMGLQRRTGAANEEG